MPGLWRLNNLLLQDEDYKARILSLIDNLGPMDDLSDPNARWDWIKYRIKSESMLYAKTKKDECKRHVRQLEECIESLSKDLDVGKSEVQDQFESVSRVIPGDPIGKGQSPHSTLQGELGPEWGAPL